MRNKIQVFFIKILKGALVLFASLMFIGALLASWHLWRVQIGLDRWLLPASWFCLAVLILGISWLLIKFPDNPRMNRWIVLGLLGIFAILFCLWLYQTPTKQLSDYKKFWKIGQQAVAGQPIYHTDNSYFSKWAYQTGFLVYVIGFLKLFGANLRLFQLLTVGQQLVVLGLTYVLAQKVFHKVQLSRLSLFLVGINLEWSALNNRVTSQYLALILFLLTFILIIDERPFSWLAAGITLALGNVLRPLGVVFLAGIVVFWLVFRCWQQPDWRKALGHLAGLIVVYWLVLVSLSSAVKLSGLNEYGLSNRDSEWKFVMGLNYPSAGAYDNAVRQKFNLHDRRQTMLKKEQRVTQEHIQDLNQNHLWLKLFVKKFFVLWSNPSNTISFSLFERNHSPKQVDRLTSLAYGVTVIEIGAVFCGAIVLLRRHWSRNFGLLVLPLFAYACAQLLIEVQGRYRIEFIPILAMIAATGLLKGLTIKEQKVDG
ncbi:hypothetical protein MOO45_06970 [Bombilactobacillus folatiphilus]|uniref:Glycosyltransferase RgtA/B/C/D-like domain-containing protein n=1 Tax=Bombilactobacillus folatiphilus TaxID=2923362 RepID=A0ABY4P8R0_9LACO|nr:hypothetical protein [Bombilactobacillus folatiphilus]UQS81924.1 hypothetical protein MOO45_06970 [Bombilactobacillus folatiphilus]